MKKITTALLIATIFSVASAFAQSGTTGPLTWVLENGTLTISGEGEMPYYFPDDSGYPPWFSYRGSIKSIVIEKGVTHIGSYAFHACLNMTSVTIDNSVTTIGNYTFNHCGQLTSIIIPNSVTSIGNGVFSECRSLTSVKLSNNLTSISKDTFTACTSLTSIIIPNSVTDIGNYAFYGCRSLTSIIIPNSVTDIGLYAFCNCISLPSIVIPNSVASIKRGTFFDCQRLTSIIIPGSVKSIGDFAFGRTNLTLITNLNPVPVEITLDVFDGVNQSECTLQVPINSVSAYQNAPVWKKFNIEGIEVGIEDIETDVVKIYPNPTTGELRIENGEWKIKNIEIYDVYGRNVSQISNLKSQISNLINISHLQAGIYFVKISTEAGVVTKKIVKN